MNHAQLDTRLRVLDAYVAHLKARGGGTAAFVWELERVALTVYDTDIKLEQPNSPERQVILGRARALGCRVTLTTDGFEISL